MKSAKLAELNFRKLLHYGGEPDGRGRLSAPIPCTGFCVACEKSGLLEGDDHRLDQMSHGADTDDFEKAICSLPPGGVDVPVAFLLESPGGYYDNGKPITYEGVTKQPPVNQYYWTAQLAEWPTESGKVHPGSYGPYFAYIIATHRLRKAYFTNIIKCSLAKRDENQSIRYQVVADPDYRDSRIRANCYNLFLSEEIRVVNPQIVFYFGKNAASMGYYVGLRALVPAAKFVTLYHPAARVSPSRIISHNDELIRDVLSRSESV